jgi:hypothetical protein
MSDPIGYWMGEPISEMSRERLLEVVSQMADMQHRETARRLQEDAVLAQLEAQKANRKRPRGILQVLGLVR